MRKRRASVLKRWVSALLVLALVGGAAFVALKYGYKYFMEQMYPLRYEDIVQREALANELDPMLIYAVIRAESSFDPDASSHADAHGLMQITPDTFEWLQSKVRDGVSYTTEDLYNPEVNIRYGSKFLRILSDKYAVRKTALSAYNAGMGNVNSWLKNAEYSTDGENLSSIPFKETRKYVESVESGYQIYKQLYGGGTE